MMRRKRGQWQALAAALLVFAALIGSALVVVLILSPSSSSAPDVSALPAPPAPAFTVPTPMPLQHSEDAASWSTVLHPVNARAAPNATAAVVTALGARTPEGTSNLVLVLGSALDEGHRLWIRARLPILPNNSTGWIPRAALGGYTLVRTHLIVDLQRLTATLLASGRRVFRAPVGVGRPQWPTPRGDFYIRDRLTSYRSPFYGPLAFGTSARSRALTDWPAGGFVGIHGTNRPELIPGRISHGCIRMRNRDILRLGRMMPVGTPLTITG